jgi:hypothetical protein
MSLQYSKDAVIKGFVGIPDQFAIYGENNTFSDVNTKTVQENRDEIYQMANNCRCYFEPQFKDECQYIPCDSDKSSSSINILLAPAPPIKKEENMLLYAFLIGVGVFVVYKILS